jgi:hypothetical protein
VKRFTVRYLFAAATALLVGWAPAPGVAYVPVADHLISLAATRLDSPPPSIVRQLRILPAHPPAVGTRHYREVVYLRFPGAFRSDLKTDGPPRVVVELGGQRWKVSEGAFVKGAPDPLDMALRLLVHTEPGGLARTLAGAGVDTTLTSMGRFNDRIAFVLGARYPDESVPQLWFDKESLLPVRWLIFRPDGDGLLRRIEIRFFAWQKTGDLHYPQAMACYRDEQLISEMRVEGIESPAELPEAVFDIDRLLKKTAPAVPPAGASQDRIRVIP